MYRTVKVLLSPGSFPSWAVVDLSYNENGGITARRPHSTLTLHILGKYDRPFPYVRTRGRQLHSEKGGRFLDETPAFYDYGPTGS
jgi:hypothetical protein